MTATTGLATAASYPVRLVTTGGFPRRLLRDVCTVNTGMRDPRLQPEQPFTYVDISSVDNTLKCITAAQTLAGKDAPSRARKRILENDVLVSTTRPNLNAVAIVPADLHDQVCSTGFCVLRAGPSVLHEFLFLFVQSPAFVNPLAELVTGALYPAVTDSQVLDRSIPLPPLTVQRQIIDWLVPALAAASSARRAAEERLAAAEALTSAYLREIFDGPGTVNWKSVVLGELTATCSGATPPRSHHEYFGGNVPWVKTGELKDNIIGVDSNPEETVTDLALRECSLPWLPVGTLLVAMYGQGQTRGRTGLLGREATTNQACFAILPNPAAFSSAFLQLWFRANYARLRALTENRGGNQPNLNGVLLRQLKVALPDLSEQHRITADLSQRITGAASLNARCRDEVAAVQALSTVLLRSAFDGESSHDA